MKILYVCSNRICAATFFWVSLVEKHCPKLNYYNYFCLFVLVSGVHYCGRRHHAQLGSHGSPDPTVLLHNYWWSDVFCYWSGVLLLTGKIVRAHLVSALYHQRRSYRTQYMRIFDFLYNSSVYWSLFLSLFTLCLSFVSSRHLVTWKLCCKQAGCLPSLLATSSYWLWLSWQRFLNG